MSSTIMPRRVKVDIGAEVEDDYAFLFREIEVSPEGQITCYLNDNIAHVRESDRKVTYTIDMDKLLDIGYSRNKTPRDHLNLFIQMEADAGPEDEPSTDTPKVYVLDSEGNKSEIWIGCFCDILDRVHELDDDLKWSDRYTYIAKDGSRYEISPNLPDDRNMYVWFKDAPVKPNDKLNSFFEEFNGYEFIRRNDE